MPDDPALPGTGTAKSSGSPIESALIALADACNAPLDLVRAKAEFETNVFGSKVEISGDEKTAQLKYISCGVWNAIQKGGKPSPEQKEKMMSCFTSATENMAKEFGFKGNLKFEGETPILTFSK